MPYITVGDQGLVVYPGEGESSLSGSQGLTNFPYIVSVTTASAATTFLQGGMYVLSSSSGAVVATLPDPGRVPGAKYIIRAGSAHAHAVTGSVAGFQSFSITPGLSTSGVRGSKAALDGSQNASVVFESDGFHYLVSACSGTVTLSGN